MLEGILEEADTIKLSQLLLDVVACKSLQCRYAVRYVGSTFLATPRGPDIYCRNFISQALGIIKANLDTAPHPA